MNVKELKEMLQILQDLKYRFKEFYVKGELLYFERYITQIDDMSNELFDVIELVEAVEK